MLRHRKRHIAAVAVAAVALTGGSVFLLHRDGGASIQAHDLPPVPGAVNAMVTQANIQQTICIPGWTATIRPFPSYTGHLKDQQISQLGLSGTSADYEEDHLIALEIGGAPTDPLNLWPEPWAGAYGARTKDRLENYLHRIVCDGSTPLADAQACIRENWIECLKANNQ